MLLLESVKSRLSSLHQQHVVEPRNQRIAAVLAHRLGDAPRILAVDCGDGAVAAALAEDVGAAEVRGVDQHPAARPAVPTQPFDGVTLPFPDASFDAVVLCDSLARAPRPQEVLAECLRVCRQCVLVKDRVVVTPWEQGLLRLVDRAEQAWLGGPRRPAWRTAGEWLGIFRETGAALTALDWPLTVDGMPWRLLAPPAQHFAARLDPPVYGGRRKRYAH